MRAELTGNQIDVAAEETAGSDDLVQDLELDRLFDVMGAGDRFVRRVARVAILAPLTDPALITIRQHVLLDCCAHPEALVALNSIAIGAEESRRNSLLMFMSGRSRPEVVLSNSVRMLRTLVGCLDELRLWCARWTPQLRSEAFGQFAAMVAHDLDDVYMAQVNDCLRELSFVDGQLMSAGVGPDGQVVGEVLRRVKQENRRLLSRVALGRPHFSFTMPDRDEAGFSVLRDVRDRSLGAVAEAAAQATDHVLAFFSQLRVQTAFYLGVGNLRAALLSLGGAQCTSDPLTSGGVRAAGLYDPCLALRLGRVPVGSDIDLGAGEILVVTGANHGGKSTFLRALGVAQLLHQVGAPVAATTFAARPVGAVFTHWAREKDAELEHGKLDEELARMHAIVEHIRPGDLLLSNESFSSTNEVEGSQIAFEVMKGLASVGVQVRCVTHMFDLAQRVGEDPGLDALFLRAPRDASGNRSYRLVPGRPLRTSFARDLFDEVFGTHLAAEPSRRD